MAIADKLLQLNQAKQDIKNAIETKGIPMTDVAFTEYANKILEISGGGVVDEYFYYSKAYYTITNNATLFPNAWQDSEDAETVLYDIPLMLVAPNQEMMGLTVDLYAGTDGTLQQLYDDCVNGVYEKNSTFIIDNATVVFQGDYGPGFGIPTPMFIFGFFLNGGNGEVNSFILGDLTFMGVGLGLVLAKWVGVPIPNNNITIQQGFEFGNLNGIILPNIIENISDGAFMNRETNNQPLVIPNSVTSIGSNAFNSWESNTHLLLIPDSVTSIGSYAFGGWQANNQPLVIPNSVISIGGWAFYNWLLVPYVEMQAIIPPSLANSNAFSVQNNAPIYVPDASVNDYKTATNWVDLASRIFPISEKP